MYYVFMDLETYSEANIRNGAYAYSEHPTTEVLLWGYAIGDAPARVWDVTAGDPMPYDLHEALADIAAGEAYSVWHNGFNFDTNVLAKVRGPAHVVIPRDRIIDTMHLAYQHGLPGALGDLSAIYKLGEDKAKDRDGKRLVQLFCKPHKYGKNDPSQIRYTKKSRPDDWERFVNYCRLDVEAERELFKRLPRFNCTKAERRLELLDDRINRRGMLMDVDLARAAIKMMEGQASESKKRTAELTDGALDSTTRTAATIQYIKDTYGVELKNLQKSEISRLIEDDRLPEPMRELLRIRLSSAKASIKKYEAILECVNYDGRLRGGLQFRGAARTGRWSGRLFQPQNLPRQTKDPEQIEEDINDVLAGTLDMFSYDVSGDLAQALRGAIMVPHGCKMVVADYSNIEGRVLAWVAGEKWKLQAFREYDAGTGPDLYKLTYSRAFNIDVAAVTKPQRQMGKVLELGMGYGGGVGAFTAFAAGYNMDLQAMADGLKGIIPPSVLEKATSLYEWALENKRTSGMKRDVWIACDCVKRLWRSANPHICTLWDSAAEACITALNEPGVRAPIALAGAVHAVKRGSWLLIRLPSGRFLCYPAAKAGSADEGCDMSYMGVNQYTRKWERIKTHGGKLCLAEGTLVVTGRGLVPIEKVTSYDAVWDGERWCSHGHVVFNGFKETIESHGVRMTPDHLILTTNGWERADEAKGHHRAPARLPDGYCIVRQEDEFGEAVVAVPMRVRKGSTDASQRSDEATQARDHGVVRLHARRNDQPEDEGARHVEASSLRSVALDEGAVRMPDASGVQELRRSGYQGMRPMEQVVRELLGGHGADVAQGSDAGSNQQRRGLQPGELPMDNVRGAGEQQAEHADDRRQAADVLGAEDGDRKNDSALPHSCRSSEGAYVRPTGRVEKVYDITNCGPLHRFVVVGYEGPVIVHNCENIIQAVACDVLANALPALEDAGYCPILTVHDEVLAEAPDSPEFNHEAMEKIMATNPEWAKGLPLAAAGFDSKRYHK